MGLLMKNNAHIEHRTSGTSLAARISCFGPVNTADGRISQKRTTHVTDRSTACKGETMESRNVGRASDAVAVSSSRVTSNK